MMDGYEYIECTSYEKTSDEFERRFPDLFETICGISVGDSQSDHIDVSGKFTDREGAQFEGTATIVLEFVTVSLEFENGINDGSLIHWFETYSKDESEEALANYRRHSEAMNDPFAIEVDDPSEKMWRDTDIEIS